MGARSYLLDCIEELAKDESATREALLAAGLEDVPRGPAVAPAMGTGAPQMPGEGEGGEEGEEVDQDALAAREEVRACILCFLAYRYLSSSPFYFWLSNSSYCSRVYSAPVLHVFLVCQYSR